MRVNWIRAEIECEGCGKPFQVKFDEGMPLAGYADLIDVAADAVRAGYTPHGGIVDTCSMQHDMPLCPACTRKTNAIGDDDYQPTREEILPSVISLPRRSAHPARCTQRPACSRRPSVR